MLINMLVEVPLLVVVVVTCFKKWKVENSIFVQFEKCLLCFLFSCPWTACGHGLEWPTKSLPRLTWSPVHLSKHLLLQASLSQCHVDLHCAMVLTFTPACSCSSTSMAARCYRRRPVLQCHLHFSTKPFARWATVLTLVTLFCLSFSLKLWLNPKLGLKSN